MTTTAAPLPDFAVLGGAHPRVTDRTKVGVESKNDQHPAGGGVRVTQALARHFGKSETWAHRTLYEHPKLESVMVAALRAYRTAGDLKGLTRVSALLRDAIDNVPAPTLTPDLVIVESNADAEEDKSEAAFLLSPSRETAVPFIQRLDAVIAHSTRLRAALAAKYIA